MSQQKENGLTHTVLSGVTVSVYEDLNEFS